MASSEDMQINKLLMKNQAYKVAIKKAKSLWKISRIDSQRGKPRLPSNLVPGKAEAQLKSKAETGDDLQYIVAIWVFFWLRSGNSAARDLYGFVSICSIFMKDFVFQIFSLCNVFTPILTEDFHQLQIENSQFVKRIEEANQDVGEAL